MSDDDPTSAGDGRQPDAEPDRAAQPVDAEQPPRLPFPVVGVGASAGGLEAFLELLDALPPDTGMAFVFVLHLPPDRESLLAEVLGRRTAMPVRQAADGMPVEVNHVYALRPGHVLTVKDGRLRLGPELGGPRAANRPVDDFFRSLAEEQRERAICVVLSGMGSNGAAGAQAVKAVGGLCVAQDPESAGYPSMPRQLIEAGYADYVLRPADMPEVLIRYAGSPYASGGREADADGLLRDEGHHLREILAVLRTRTRQDFAGYKKPTLLRRVQRRMGMTRAAGIGEYARLLRQTPAEVSALADDLLIHVTGFFRDPEAWEALRRRVVVPLVAGREAGGAVRAWVAACSSGEEAYSLAMLLVEEYEHVGKPLDVKVFATDLADRTLAHARAGVYPGGIESEVSPERLARFFVREAEVYRIRADLRDRVVFAPQNVLQDPPFSRIDVACCRNLLIYLEPDVQRRVLHLLHFGLREGGTLFLGSSEAVAGAEDQFEPVDKKWRIFRRVGPTRHGAVEFPLPHPVGGAEGRDAALSQHGPAVRRRPDGSPASVADLTRRALLADHTPPAVTVDRDGRVVYYHGDPAPFLQLSGEPTRELMMLAREGVRGAARVALQRAAAENVRATVADGWVEPGPGRRHRVAVTASPAPADPVAGGGPTAYFVVSFEDRGEVPSPAAGGPGESVASDDELRRLRGELQSTIEELQTSNEELRASHEEVTSVNEELQSSNEELETSKEEMQSLNEELTTVNAQLRAKMEEHQAAASDLASLLASSDIAVLFLDTHFRIRRFTPAFRALMDLLPTDVGRPLSALARAFDDPALDADCRTVLERLIPAEREVPAASGRHFLRRATPYRTTENRIDGVVVTFVDITDRKRAEEALAAEKEFAENIIQTLHEPLLVLRPDLTVRSVNPAFYSQFGVTAGDTVGRKVYHLGNGQWDIPDLRTLLEDVLPDSHAFVDYEVEHEFEGLGRRVMLVNGRRLDHVQLILLGIRDITDRKRAEEAVQASEEKYRLLFRNMGEGFALGEMIWDEQGRPADWRYLDVNEAWTAQTGVPVGQTRGRTAREVNPRIESGWIETYGRVAQTGQPTRYEAYAEGFGRWFETFAFKHSENHFALLFRDVTDRKQAEDALRASEEKYRKLFDSMDEAYAVVEMFRDEAAGRWADFRFLEVNPAFVKHTGMPYPVGKTATELLGNPNPRWAEVYGRVTDTGEPVRMEEGEPTLDRVFDLYIFRLGGAGSRRVAVLFTDVTPRKRAEEALRASDARFRSVANLVPDLLWSSRSDGHTDWYNQRWSEYTGQPPEQAVGWGWTDAIHPDDREGSARRNAEAVEFGRTLVQEHRIRRHDGEYRWFLVRAEPVHDPAGRLTMFGSATDIHDQRTMIAALGESEGRLRAVAANLPNAAVFVVGPDLRYALAAGEALAAAGFVAADLEGKTLAEALPPPLTAEYTANYRRALAGEPFQTEHAAHGRHYVTHGVPLRDAAGAVTAALAVSYDITDRMAAEDALRRAEERLRLALAAARMGTWTWDVEADRHARDPNLNALLGLEAAETASPLAEFLGHIHPDDRDAVRAAFEQSVRRGRPLSLEFRVVRPDGEVRWLRDQGDVFGTAGRTRLAGACVDVTDLKEAEAALRRANDELEDRVRGRTADLAAAIDALEAEMVRRRDLARRLATAQEDERRRVARDLHDSVGQLLAGLSLALKAVESADGMPPATAAKLADARRVSDELGREVHALAVRLRPTALDDLGLEAALGQLVAEWAVQTGVPADFQAAGLSRGRLPAETETTVYRVVQEGLTNAAKHARASRVSVTLTADGGRVTAVVEDDGAGFDPEASPKGRLGLVGMRERAALLGGEVVVESAPEAGTTVVLSIPILGGGGP